MATLYNVLSKYHCEPSFTRLNELPREKKKHVRKQFTTSDQHVKRAVAGCLPTLFCISPLVNEDKFAVDGVPGHILCRLHPDVCQAGLGDDVGMQAANSHQAAQVAALIVRLVVLVETHLGGRPALQVARAMDGAEALAVGCDESGEETQCYK